jgi:hypothetical protein
MLDGGIHVGGRIFLTFSVKRFSGVAGCWIVKDKQPRACTQIYQIWYMCMFIVRTVILYGRWYDHITIHSLEVFHLL